jgi:hypothetical protein
MNTKYLDSSEIFFHNIINTQITYCLVLVLFKHNIKC